MRNAILGGLCAIVLQYAAGLLLVTTPLAATVQESVLGPYVRAAIATEVGRGVSTPVLEAREILLVDKYGGRRAELTITDDEPGDNARVNFKMTAKEGEPSIWLLITPDAVVSDFGHGYNRVYLEATEDAAVVRLRSPFPEGEPFGFPNEAPSTPSKGIWLWSGRGGQRLAFVEDDPFPYERAGFPPR